MEVAAMFFAKSGAVKIPLTPFKKGGLILPEGKNALPLLEGGWGDFNPLGFKQ